MTRRGARTCVEPERIRRPFPGAALTQVSSSMVRARGIWRLFFQQAGLVTHQMQEGREGAGSREVTSGCWFQPSEEWLVANRKEEPREEQSRGREIAGAGWGL